MAKPLIDQIEEVLDRKLQKVLGLKRHQTFDDKLEEVLGLKHGQTFDDKLEEVLGLRHGQSFDDKFEAALDCKVGLLIEHFDDKFDSLAEATLLINEMVGKLPTRDEFNEVKADVKVLKIALRDTNRDMKGW